MDSNIPNNIDPYINRTGKVSGDTYINGSGSVDSNFSDRDSWKTMMTNFYTDMSRLMQKEGQLIRAEMNDKATQIKVAGVSMVTAGVLLFVGALCAAATAILVLDLFMSAWIAAAIVTGVLLVMGGIMFAGAKKKLNADDLKPNKSIQAFGEIRHSLQEKVHEITKH
jgi:hypothetical protein